MPMKMLEKMTRKQIGKLFFYLVPLGVFDEKRAGVLTFNFRVT